MASLQMLPVVAVIGRKKSGKTSIVKSLIENLQVEGHKVMSAKHVDVKNFTIDKEGTDTWWHSKVGANPVVCVSDSETAIIYKDGASEFSLDRLVRYATENVDLIIMEGFSRWVLKDRSVAKIVMVKDRSEYVEYSRDVRGPVLCFCSYSIEPGQGKILNAEKEMDRILKKVTNFLEDRKELDRILAQLPGLDCGKCSYRTCLGLARAMRKGRASLRDCVVMHPERKRRSAVLVDGEAVPLTPYVSDLIGKTILAMVSTLKGVNVQGEEHVEVRISKEPGKTKLWEKRE